MSVNNSEKYKKEVEEKWGQTGTYNEYIEKTKNYSSNKWDNIIEGMNEIFAEFSCCMKNGNSPKSSEVQLLVKKLQNHITENYYCCTNEILLGLGQMYILDERFKKNIDKNAEGTACFVHDAINLYCGK